MDTRPWSEWGPKSGRRLGTLLRNFGIISSHLHGSGNTDFRGYRMEDFQDAWERYLSPLTTIAEDKQFRDSPDGNTVADGMKTASVLPSDLRISAIGAD